MLAAEILKFKCFIKNAQSQRAIAYSMWEGTKSCSREPKLALFKDKLGYNRTLTRFFLKHATWFLFISHGEPEVDSECVGDGHPAIEPQSFGCVGGQ
jgi:hypothetical protein